MDSANVNLSENELLLVTNTDWILTKHRIVEKVYQLFGQLSGNIRGQGSYLPAEVLAIPPKIYKGEQYKYLPYVLMDYPRHFKEGNFFAIRFFFWWGNYFSITLQLSGKYKQQYQGKIVEAYHTLAGSDWFVCVSNDEWQHDFEPGNYLPAGEMDEQEWQEFIYSHLFIKVAKKIPLHEWEKAYHFFTENYFLLNHLLTGNIP